MNILKDKNKRKTEILENIEKIKTEMQQVKNLMNMETNECLIDSYIYALNSLERQYEYYVVTAREEGIRSFKKIS